jgi:hypothetical protein
VRLSWSGFRAGGQHVPCSHVKLKPNLSLNLSLPNLSLNLDRIRYELARVHSIGLSWTNARRWDTGATTHDRFVSRRGTRKSNAGAIAACEVHASINIAPTDFTTSNAVHLCNLICNTPVDGAVLILAAWQRNRTRQRRSFAVSIKIASKAARLSEVDAPDEAASMAEAAAEFKVPATRLMAVGRRLAARAKSAGRLRIRNRPKTLRIAPQMIRSDDSTYRQCLRRSGNGLACRRGRCQHRL